MSTKRKKTKSKNSTIKIKSPKPLNYAKIVKRFLITLFFLGIIAVPVIAYVQQSKIEHDLSVIGNGTPTVVQIHDTSCQLCRQLKSNLGKVKGEFKDDIQFKTANIKTHKGKRFTTKYNVPHVTLLFFDKQGKRVDTLQGVSTPDEIKSVLQELSHGR